MRIRDLLPAMALVLVCISWLGVAMLRPQPGQSQVGVVFPPYLDATDVLGRIAESGGRLIREGAWPFVAVVSLDEPDTLNRLSALGALFTVNPLALGSCFTSPAAAPLS